ncbi:MAG: class I SAM-dependent methyltransferase [Pseudomonadota bacterium]
MSFSADWLDLRADADRQARNPDMAARLSARFQGVEGLRILDLGSGTGANMRLTSQLLGPKQHWTLVDNDPALLSTVTGPTGVGFETRQADLARDLDSLFDTGVDLVTASAFFDLAGAELIDSIVSATVDTGAAFYTVLTYDGEETWSPAHAADSVVHQAFLADQQTDKGLGPARGPAATVHLANAFRSHGYVVAQGKSDWVLSQPEDAALIAALAQGAASAVENTVGDVAWDWARSRQTAESVRIGHLDLFAHPPEDPTRA